MFKNRNQYGYFIPIVIFVFIDIYLSTMSWQEIRTSLGWVKEIPQKTDFKLRHIVQFSPQSFYISYVLFKLYKISSLRRLIFSTSFILCVGAVSELIQFYTATRIASFVDLGWNLLAGFIGASVFEIIPKLQVKNKNVE